MNAEKKEIVKRFQDLMRSYIEVGDEKENCRWSIRVSPQLIDILLWDENGLLEDYYMYLQWGEVKFRSMSDGEMIDPAVIFARVRQNIGFETKGLSLEKKFRNPYSEVVLENLSTEQKYQLLEDLVGAWEVDEKLPIETFEKFSDLVFEIQYKIDFED